MAHSKQDLSSTEKNNVIDLLKETRKIGHRPMDTPIGPNHKSGEI